jgi:hypothetical protein
MSSDEFGSFGLLLLLLSAAHLFGDVMSRLRQPRVVGEIINAEFYTALLILAVVTSQAAGGWLDYAVRRGLPLLSEPMATVTAHSRV